MSDLHTYKVMQEGDAYPRPRPASPSTSWYLVAIAVFVFFVAGVLWFPIVTRDDRPHRSMVISNLKQCALAGLIYASDYDEKLPPAETWMDAIEPYHKNPVIPRDSSVQDAKEDEYGFAFFEPVSLADLDRIANVEEVPMVFQSVLMGRNAHSDLRTLPSVPRGEDGLNFVSFCDGHAKGFPPTWPKRSVVILTKTGEK